MTSKVDLSNRWTVLNIPHASVKATTPEFWSPVHFGVNTAPGFLDRKQTEIAIAIYGKAEISYTDELEVYMVTEKGWRMTGKSKAWAKNRVIGCLEKRIGRRLKPDFPDHAFNSPDLPATRRLLKRRGHR